MDIANAVSVQLPEGSTVFSIGDSCEQFILLDHGHVRVDLLTQTGRKIMLYRLGAGDTCTITSACLMSNSSYSATAVAETAIDARMLPAEQFLYLMKTDSDFQSKVFKSLSDRLSLLMGKVAEVAFTSLDARLAARLLELAASTDIVQLTHDQLASDVGSVREVVSRKLAAMEGDGILQRGRGELRLTNRSQLEYLASLVAV